MNKMLVHNRKEEFRSAELKAAHYFHSLHKHLKEKTYVQTLTSDIHSWKMNHIHTPTIFSYFSRKKRKSTMDGYHSYLEWLNYTGKLDNYLDRSISYLFMRDLGKSLANPVTERRIQDVVGKLKEQILKKKETKTSFDFASFYEFSRKESVELTMIWIFEKMKKITANIPDTMSVEHAQRKIWKILAGVVFHELDDRKGKNLLEEERIHRLESAMKLGFYYGLTYPFIDDLFDAKVLSKKEEQQYAELIRETLVTGVVPELGIWDGENRELITYIHEELKEAFEYMKSQHQPDSWDVFLEQAYIFFHSQEIDRQKDLSNNSYSNEDIYIPVILKSSSSRLIVRSLINAVEDEGFDKRTFYYGIYNQLADDLADMFDDEKDGAVTPYTYFLKYYGEREDLINPFEMYWTVISYLLHEVYHSDPKTQEVILDRAINGLKRLKEKLGDKKYQSYMSLFTTNIPKFNQLIQQMVNKADDVDFFDKLLRDHMITSLKESRKELEDFKENVTAIRAPINKMLSVLPATTEKEIILEAANYSLEGDGKRLRPIITWFMGVNEFGIDSTAIVPLLRTIEYMHTASLIFDDLPSQDNASLRRGRKTLHEKYDVATAELTGLFLTQRAIEEQTNLQGFSPASVVKLINYTSTMTADMCKGQLLDLNSKGKTLSLDELNTICLYKTGIGFEAALLMPAILANKSKEEMELLKTFAHHAGIAFQIKDDLLDAEGNSELLGKKAGMDEDNQTSTFVTVLGIEAARKEMWDHYFYALEILPKLTLKTSFLKCMLEYIVNRDR
ncbi:polyprenyl synthetase family protein [Bacillus sp. B1-b2]|uniref:polyprenyl synthetase family protein n=1 Tax=Bacillus sp. B1-b2 TaxID=2653201 RepID=UPI0012622D64|nr:polyprenyl synthetase family protein [Bacillus sp. B1-b2]KAB7664906.1 polyprenyl synthetase family protein [Bacillus sp. B1-b2]